MASRVEELVPFAANDSAAATREWFTAAELAELALPGLPADKRSINRKAQTDRWSMRQGADGAPLLRPRAGRGGGVEYHVSLLPGGAQLDLVRRGIVTSPGKLQAVEPETDTAAGSWRWYDAQKAPIKAKAEQRLAIVNEVLTLESATGNRTAAIAEAAGAHGVSTSTVWNWMAMIDGVAPKDRLPALAPRHRGGGKEAEIDFLLWAAFKSDYLRPEQPTLSACFTRTAAIAAERGLSMPSEASFRRRLKREIDPAILKLRREGEEALRRSVPSQRRTLDGLRALELVNIDGHKFDLFVTPPGGGKPIRPLMVAIQDVYSRKVLAWRIGGEESAVQTRLAFADLFRDVGIPRAVLMDNGRAFASKWITGGAKSRFRFKIRAEEPTGLLTGLGIEIHWALPYRGQSKPIERAFRDLCEYMKAPQVAGAYTGNNPLAKPDNYGSNAIEWDVFVAHVADSIAKHNAKLGRRGGVCRGRSFDQVFEESYASAPIGKATPEQLRMALLAADQVTVKRQTGEIELFGNRYWSQESSGYAGQKVTVRFDPDNLHSDVFLYGLDGAFLASAELIADTGFLEAAGAREAAKRVKNYRQRARDGLVAEQLLAAEELAALQPDTRAPALPEPAVLRPIRQRGSAAPALQPNTQPTAPAIDRMTAAILRLVPSED